MVRKSLTISRVKSAMEASAVAAPESLPELLRRAAALAGRSIGALAEDCSVALPADPRRAKGFVGELVEGALGASAGNLDLPDFPELGVELKTIPLDREGRVQESTFVCAIALEGAAQSAWETSRAWRKLRRVLWMPVEAASVATLAERRLGRARLWEPDAAEEARLRADWTMLMGRIALGRFEELDATLGAVLQVRPKAANAAVEVELPGAEGDLVRTGPRGFYLRARFTEELLWRLSA